MLDDQTAATRADWDKFLKETRFKNYDQKKRFLRDHLDAYFTHASAVQGRTELDMIVSAGIPIRPWLSDNFSGMRNHAGTDKVKKSSAEGGKIFRKQAVPARRADRRNGVGDKAPSKSRLATYHHDRRQDMSSVAIARGDPVPTCREMDEHPERFQAPAPEGPRAGRCASCRRSPFDCGGRDFVICEHCEKGVGGEYVGAQRTPPLGHACNQARPSMDYLLEHGAFGRATFRPEHVRPFARDILALLGRGPPSALVVEVRGLVARATCPAREKLIASPAAAAKKARARAASGGGDDASAYDLGGGDESDDGAADGDDDAAADVVASSSSDDDDDDDDESSDDDDDAPSAPPVPAPRAAAGRRKRAAPAPAPPPPPRRRRVVVESSSDDDAAAPAPVPSVADAASLVRANLSAADRAAFDAMMKRAD